ncbi:CpsD/CapB family tyrosine-protein kinase [Tundrisphaera lichenicola]|uniref:CpsD/CapB family tyrosine-protein kinase n=1 Tax=Tundrisphaera lichenicola TaxID=2029860 RepID=UPI003EC022A4
MGDIDQALARAYARRGTPEAPMVPPPHFPIEPPVRSTPPSTVLEWPSTVRALEREHGDRFEHLADALIAARDQQLLKVLLFTSCHRSEGRTTLVLTLARALARRPGRTLLVDADLSGPMLARLLGLRPRLGLDDVIEEGVAATEAVIEAPDDHLSILPLRAAVSRPREFLSSPAWPTAMARLRRDFDLVLVDGGPLFAGLSHPPLPRGMDAAILVHNRSLTGAKAVVRAREALDGGGIPLLGLAETFV